MPTIQQLVRSARTTNYEKNKITRIKELSTTYEVYVLVYIQQLQKNQTQHFEKLLV